MPAKLGIIDWIENLTHSVFIWSDDAISCEFTDNVIVEIKASSFLVKSDTHKHSFKTWISTYVCNEVRDVGVSLR